MKTVTSILQDLLFCLNLRRGYHVRACHFIEWYFDHPLELWGFRVDYFFWGNGIPSGKWVLVGEALAFVQMNRIVYKIQDEGLAVRISRKEHAALFKLAFAS